MDDSVVMSVAQHCPKLEKIILSDVNKITYKSFIALSEQCLPLEELDIAFIPYIPKADIVRRCSYALSCNSHLTTSDLHLNDLDVTILLPYLTGLTSVDLDYYANIYIYTSADTALS